MEINGFFAEKNPGEKINSHHSMGESAPDFYA